MYLQVAVYKLGLKSQLKNIFVHHSASLNTEVGEKKPAKFFPHSFINSWENGMNPKYFVFIV